MKYKVGDRFKTIFGEIYTVKSILGGDYSMYITNKDGNTRLSDFVWSDSKLDSNTFTYLGNINDETSEQHLESDISYKGDAAYTIAKSMEKQWNEEREELELGWKIFLILIVLLFFSVIGFGVYKFLTIPETDYVCTIEYIDGRKESEVVDSYIVEEDLITYYINNDEKKYVKLRENDKLICVEFEKEE